MTFGCRSTDNLIWCLAPSHSYYIQSSLYTLSKVRWLNDTSNWLYLINHSIIQLCRILSFWGTIISTTFKLGSCAIVFCWIPALLNQKKELLLLINKLQFHLSHLLMVHRNSLLQESVFIRDLKFFIRNSFIITKNSISNFNLLVTESEISIFEFWFHILFNRCVQLTTVHIQ
jgi:hypothetical protein